MEWVYPADVQGWLTKPEARQLARLASGKRVLEVGSYCGKSTIALAQTAPLVVSVDWHQGDGGAGFGWTLPQFLQELRKWGVLSRVIACVGRSEQVLPLFEPRTFDLVFIDGAHDPDSVRIDLDGVLRVLKPGGTLAMHDWHAVKHAVHERLGTDGTEQVADSLMWRQVHG